MLHDIGFEAEPGDTVALVGPTGAGKSTLRKLLLRLYEVDRGEISVDGHDVRDLTLSSLRGAIGYVGQDAYLFDGSVAENVRYGDFDASDRQVRETVEAAEAHEFIQDLPEGYDTRIGERGVKLSADSNNGSRSPGRSFRTWISSFSTRRPATSIPRPSDGSRRASTGSPPSARRSRSPTGSRR